LAIGSGDPRSRRSNQIDLRSDQLYGKGLGLDTRGQLIVLLGSGLTFDGDGRVTTASGQTTATYTVANVSPTRSLDADSTSTAELADVLGTLISDLQAQGIVR